jgi:molecular chaperone HscA
VFEVLSTGGDSALGGDDFDHRLFCWIHRAGANWRRCRTKTPRADGQGARSQGTAVVQAEVTHIDAVLVPARKCT